MFWFQEKIFRLENGYRNWTLVSVPDTETKFQSHTSCSSIILRSFFFITRKDLYQVVATMCKHLVLVLSIKTSKDIFKSRVLEQNLGNQNQIPNIKPPIST